MRLAVFALMIPLMLGCDDSGVLGPIVPVAERTVTTTNALRFSPSTVHLILGGKVIFAFNSVGHSVNFANIGGAPADIGITFSTSVERIFNTAGTYTYVCTVHGAPMSGTVVVHAD